MAYFPPRFNIWATVIDGGGAGVRGWTRCQLRGAKPNLTYQTRDALVGGEQLLAIWEVLFPAGSDVRGFLGADSHPDAIRLNGSTQMEYQVVFVGDIGAGFPNEYRLALVTYQGAHLSFGTPHRRPSPLVLPPDGYVPLPIIPSGPL